MQIGEEMIEHHQRRIGIVGAREVIEQQRQQFGEVRREPPRL